ncbi:peptidase S8 S53 subtilisin kexin sedolisin [Fusarium napiforme]|uniref:tripeptidyl-peptidase II n=1 Tax=Fusarium napiforme TaxID=42672 RepID=A0A8H5I2Y5_9HYPO|nr:peptidase S8 S53 subtilisin kexin sedolisin [Fusarium napiforme]
MKMLYICSLMLVAAAAASVHQAHVRHGPSGLNWEHEDRVSPDEIIPVRVALTQRNLEYGMDHLLNVSDPASPNYGKYYSAQDVIDIFAPDDESIATVKNWLSGEGIPASAMRLSNSKGWLDFSTNASKLEAMLQTQLYHRRSAPGAISHISAERYVLPRDVSPYVDFISPARGSAASVEEKGSLSRRFLAANSAPLPPSDIKKLKSQPASTQYCNTYVTPECIKALYKIPGGTLKNSNNKLGIFEEDDEFPEQSDLNKFYGLFAPEIPAGYGPKVDYIDYGESRPNATYYAVGEAAIDFDVSQPIIYPQTTELFQTKTQFNPAVKHFGIFNQFLDAIDGAYCSTLGGDDPNVDGITPNEQCGTFKATPVISISYGWPEAEYPAGYLERQCQEYMKLGLQGTTIVLASGDGGVAGGHGGNCLGRDGSIFNPSAPGTCPYVTTVGATELPSGESVDSPQVATTKFGSGGGFSNVWTAPSYQQDALSSYFENCDPGFPFYSTSGGVIPENGTGIYNRAGRGFPDVSATGSKGVIVLGGDVLIRGGSSMAAPIVAAMFTRINEELLAKGKNTIGFANPVLYRNPTAFTDITVGNQAGNNGTCKGKGFSAVPGWDPVTGLGTPVYPKLLDAFLQAQTS